MKSLIGLLLTVAIVQPVQANWWEKGQEALKSFENSETGQKITSVISDNSGTVMSQFSNQDLEKAFRQALSIGSETVVKQLGQTDGFNADSNIHIPLPKSLNTVKKTLDRFGAGHLVGDLETKLNRAAEAATPKAKALFLDAIANMSFEDVQAIYKGDKDAATQFLKRTTSPQLKQEMTPIIDNSLSEVGAIQAYDSVMNKYAKYPFVPDVKADLQSHVMDKALDGIFYYVAQEEAAIRQDPLKRSTELLKKVFAE